MIELIVALTMPGMMVLKVCSADPTETHGNIIIDPDYVVVIYHSRDTPKGCVKLSFKDGRGVYVVGDDETVAKLRAQALRERQGFGPR